MERADLLEAYLATTYVVEGPHGRIEIRVGEPCVALDALLAERVVGAWAFLTAQNPGSRRLDAAENDSRQRALEAELRARGLEIWPGEGVGDAGSWPPERSVLVVGISLDDAVAIARRFEQRAIVFGVIGGLAELVFCDGATPA